MNTYANDNYLQDQAIALGSGWGVHLHTRGVGFKTWNDAKAFIEIVEPSFAVKIIERDTTRLGNFTRSVTPPYEVVAVETN